MSTTLRLSQIETIDTGINSLGFIQGYTLLYSNTTSLTVNPGTCLDSTNTTELTMGSSRLLYVNQVFGANDGLDTGSVTADRTYYVYIISNGTTVRTLASLNSATPTLPGGYTSYRMIGCFYVTNTSVIAPFIHAGKYNRRTYYFNSANSVYNDAAYNNTTPKTISLTNKIPPIADSALLNAYGHNTSSTEAVYVVSLGFQDTGYRIEANNNYSAPSSDGSYDISGEFPLLSGRTFQAVITTGDPIFQDRLTINLNGYRYEV